MFRILFNEVLALGHRILRMPRTCGFGVQSPTAYFILRNVLNEKSFLNKYQIIYDNDVSYPIHTTKQERLFFRLHSYFPQIAVIEVLQLNAPTSMEILLSSMSPQSVLLVKKIRMDKVSEEIWNRLVADSHTILTYDLWDCGILFFDNTKIKQNFKVNY